MENWEEEFDKTFDLDGFGDSHIVQKKVKSFIKKVIEAEKEKLLNELRNN